MKTLKSICAAAVLALSLSIPAYADDPIPGIIHTPGMTASEPSGAAVASPVESDISLSAFSEMLWALAGMF
jgi:hypothetical protein